MYSLENIYKSETGEKPYTCKTVKTELRRTHYMGVALFEINDSYVRGNELTLPTPEYIEWLEEKASIIDQGKFSNWQQTNFELKDELKHLDKLVINMQKRLSHAGSM